MFKKRESTSSPFVHRVLVPGVRNLLIFFAALAIAFGSWLETNDAIDDCSARTQISFLQVNMLRNISSNEVLPDTVSFGLWRHCFVYALNCTCTSHELTYTLDAPAVLEAATTNNTAIPQPPRNATLIPLIPLLLSTAFGSLAIFFGIAGQRLQRWVWLDLTSAGMTTACVVLVALVFGYTYHEYITHIQSACNNLGGRCSKVSYGIDFILLVIGLGCSGLATLLWVISFLPEWETQPTKRKTAASSAMLSVTTEKRKSNSVSAYQRHSSVATQQSFDALEPWREAAMLDEQHAWIPMKDEDDHHAVYGMNHPLPPPQRYRRGGDYYEEEELVPPSRPFASSQHRTRRTSQGSGNTFGANNMLRNSRTSSVTLDESMMIESGSKTPNSMHSHHNTNRLQEDYFCITPVDQYPSDTSISSHSPTRPSRYDDRRRSSSNILHHNNNSSGSSGNSYAQHQHRSRRCSRSPLESNLENVPRLSSPPEANRHPLNRKVITDQRISAYLQQPQRRRS